MTTLIHADIFFFVSTIVLVIIGIFIVIALLYVIRILRTVSDVTKKVKAESDNIIEDVRSLRGNIKSEGFKMKYVILFMKSMFKKGRSRRTEKSSEGEE